MGRNVTEVSEEFSAAMLGTILQDGGRMFLEKVTTHPTNYMSRKTVICHNFLIYLAVQCEGNA
jgi:hypothetical protein